MTKKVTVVTPTLSEAVAERVTVDFLVTEVLFTSAVILTVGGVVSPEAGGLTTNSGAEKPLSVPMVS